MTPCVELSSGRGTRSATQYRRPAAGRATLCAGRLSSSRRTRRCRGRRRSRAPAPRRPRASAARAGPARVRRRGAMRRATGRPRRRHTRTRRRPSRVTYPLGVTARSTPAGPHRGGHGGREVRSVKVTTTVIREPLQDVFFAAADRAMRDAGWRSACDVPYVIAPLEGRYFRESGGPFVRVAKFDYLGPCDDPKTRKRHAAAFVGVTFPAAERVLSALGAFSCNVTVAEDAGLAARGREFSKRVRSDADVEAAVTEAVGLIEAGAARVADEISDVDTLIAPLLDDPAAYGARHKHPAILAAAGRADEARQALHRYREESGTPRFDAYCDRLDAFIRAGATIPPPSEHAFPEPPQAVSTTTRFGWGDIKPGHRLAVVGLMFRLLARRIVHRPDRRGPLD